VRPGERAREAASPGAGLARSDGGAAPSRRAGAPAEMRQAGASVAQAVPTLHGRRGLEAVHLVVAQEVGGGG